MSTVIPGNKTHVFPSPSPNSTRSREREIVNRTQRQAFPGHDERQIPKVHANYGGAGEGHQNSIAEMTHTAGKDLSESYRRGLDESRSGHDRVADR